MGRHVKRPLKISDRPVRGRPLGASKLSVKEKSKEKRDWVSNSAMLLHPAISSTADHCAKPAARPELKTWSPKWKSAGGATGAEQVEGQRCEEVSPSDPTTACLSLRSAENN